MRWNAPKCQIHIFYNTTKKTMLDGQMNRNELKDDNNVSG